MTYFVITLVAFVSSGLTFFSGFGLGTILLPVFTIFFPVEIAIGLTAIVHFLNNFFKLFLVGSRADWKTVWRFATPAIPFAWLGAYILTQIGEQPSLADYQLFGKSYEILPLKLCISFLMIGFALMEIIPSAKNWTVDPKYLSIGGMLSGFFGGLSGHQGALRSAFLARAGLNKESFIGTGVVIACCVDVTRLRVYGIKISKAFISTHMLLLITACSAAFIGAFVGNQWLKKTSIDLIQKIVAILLFIMALLIGLGVI